MTEMKLLPEEELDDSIFEFQTNPPQRILLADADADIRCLNAEVLTDSGYDVDAVEDGVTAMNSLQVNSYDLLITDIDLPKMSGIDLLKKIHAMRIILPSILVSELMPTELLNPHPWLQIKARLHKPCTLAKLLETVGSVLRAKHAARADIMPMPIFRIQSPIDRLRF